MFVLQTTCSDSNDGWGRKRRQADGKGSGVEDIAAGSTISISTEEVVIESKCRLLMAFQQFAPRSGLTICQA